MSSRISFIGDVMLGRIIGEKYAKNSYSIVSENLISKCADSDLVIANLESPVVERATTEGDHLQFRGNPDVLDKMHWIHLFSLSNNHINDCGEEGMNETVDILEKKNYAHNGLFKDHYEPFIYEKDGKRYAIVMLTDMMNIPFNDTNQWDVLRMDDGRVFDILNKFHNNGYAVLLYAHVGILFSRYPNPIAREFLHKCVDNGADIIITAHAHCLGCMEEYKGHYIFHSLGDFVMDGNSFRRRRSAILTLELNGSDVLSYKLHPAEIDKYYVTSIPSDTVSEKMIRDFNETSHNMMKHSDNYESFFKWQYKKEMIHHTFSTIHFLIAQKGVRGMLKMVMKRKEEVGRMFKWVSKDRSKDQRDDDAIKKDRKKFSQEELF